MRLPNKFTSYKQSILYKIPFLLEILENEDCPVKTLFTKTKNKAGIETVDEYIDILDCLFMLGKIELREDFIHYVKEN